MIHSDNIGIITIVAGISEHDCMILYATDCISNHGLRLHNITLKPATYVKHTHVFIDIMSKPTQFVLGLPFVDYDI